MSKTTDIRPVAASLYFLPIEARVPLKFGREITTHVTCARTCVRVTDRTGRTADGWGETPLSVQWVWPSTLSYEHRHARMKNFCVMLAEAWAGFQEQGHPIELGHDFMQHVLPDLLRKANAARDVGTEEMPWLAALVCCSLFDIALHDAYGILHQRPVYQTYGPEFMNRCLADFLVPAEGAPVTFADRYPSEFLLPHRPNRLRAWHLVGGLDPLEESQLTGTEPRDGYPVLLADWIARDGLKCLKVKLHGNDSAWDYQRLVEVGAIGIRHDVDWLTRISTAR